ncbi:MAG: AraC family transcriptional regulator [Hungatella sp.]
MKRQNDWYTGINYYDRYRETQITVQRKTIISPYKTGFHEQVQLIYVLSGNALMKINSCDYQATAGSFFCLYSHHFYEIHSITEKLDVICIQFYIGLFMYMSWEKHPKNANAKLVYDTCPMVLLSLAHRKKIEELCLKLLEEAKEERFGSHNLVTYQTLELHTYFCRYAFEEIGMNQKSEDSVWSVIKKVLLATSQNLELKEIAAELHTSPRALNQKIKEVCGYTFFQLQQMGTMLNACALLHFPDLTISYVSDLTGFSSVTAFYRVFEQYCKLTPREYQRQCICGAEGAPSGSSLAMQFLQYIHLNFMHPLTLEEMSAAFYVKPYAAQEIMKSIFDMNFKELLNEIRICYAASLLKTRPDSALSISVSCGFDSYSTFQRTFQFYMNQTPTEYRSM